MLILKSYPMNNSYREMPEMTIYPNQNFNIQSR